MRVKDAVMEMTFPIIIHGRKIKLIILITDIHLANQDNNKFRDLIPVLFTYFV
jgi:hypothetical protein